MTHYVSRGETSGVLLGQIADYAIIPVVANVHFGVPGGNGDCLQIGICRVVIDCTPITAPLANRQCRQARAICSVNSDGDLEMYFPAKGIMPCTERAIFRSKWFPVPEAYHLPADMLCELTPGVTPVIAPGKYPITKVAGGYIITF